MKKPITIDNAAETREAIILESSHTSLQDSQESFGSITPRCTQRYMKHRQFDLSGKVDKLT